MEIIEVDIEDKKRELIFSRSKLLYCTPLLTEGARLDS